MKPSRLFAAVLAAVALVVAMPVSAQAPASLDGTWLGTLVTGGPELRLQLHLHETDGKWSCTLDSLDQGAMGIPCSVTSATNPVAISVDAVHGGWSGKLSSDTLIGLWTQGADLPLTLKRVSEAAKPIAAREPDAALPAANAKAIKSILDKDLAEALATGALAPATSAGVSIGVLSHGEHVVFSYGTAKPDSVFEIGSISKTFTATILAQMVEQKRVRLDEPVRELLPPGVVEKPRYGDEITLLDLSDQHSGLPRMPDNFRPADLQNPYADYSDVQLMAYVKRHGVAREANAPFGYSNLGVGLLGNALAHRAETTYPKLLEEQVTGPLGMKETAVVLTPSMRERFITGHDEAHHVAHAWDLDALAGAGGIRSTAGDMLTYLAAEMHPEKLITDNKTLPAAIAMTHVIHADAGPGGHIALNWFHIDATGSFWHNGATGGYSSYALFNIDRDYAVVVLSNTSVGKTAFADKLGQHIAQRLAGVPAISLGN